MLNYNLNIIEPLKQDKKNEDVRPPIYWDFHSFASASDSTDLSERTFATMSIDAPGTNCIQVSVDSGNSFTTDGQYPVTASVTGSNWPITGSTTMSLFTFGITYDPTSTDQFYIAAVSASAAQINVNPSITGSIITNEFSASEFYRWYVSGSVIHMKGNVYNGPINWLARNQSPSTTTGNVNGFTSSFNIVKDRNVRLVNLQEVTGSTSSSFNNTYALNITSSLTASIINDTTGSTTMSITIPEVGISTASLFFNKTSAGTKIITASFVASQNEPYNITASVTFNKGNILDAKVNWLTTGSNADSYSMHTIPTQFNVFKDVDVDRTVINQSVLMAHSELTQSVSGEFQTQYAFNFETEVTQSGTYPSYQVYAYPTTSLVITPDVGNTTVYNSGSTLQFTEQIDGPSYQITASAYINKIPSLFATVVVIGAGGSGSRNGSDGSEVKGAGGGAGGFYQSDIIIAPNLPYVIERIAKNPTDADFTKFTYYNGISSVYGTTDILAFSGNSALGGGGGRSGYVNIYPSDAPPVTVQGLNNGNINTGGGGGGTYNSASGANGGLDLGGAGSFATASVFPTLFFQSASFQLTGSAGNGNTLVMVSGSTSTAFGGGGGGALASGDYAGPAGTGGPGVVIVAYSGSQKLTVPTGTITRFENGLTVHIFKQTGSFSYDYVPVPNPAEQPYQWRTETLVIAGGGCGGSDEGGGGGAGGYSYNPNFYYELGKTYNVTVGPGQPAFFNTTSSKSGSDSYITDSANNTIIFSKGGGSGFALPGGSGGGASSNGDGAPNVNGYVDANYYFPIGQQQGFPGGAADNTFTGAGGGGGASSTGSLSSRPGGSAPTPNSGGGGIGAYTIDFIPVRVCGGGTGTDPGGNALNLGAAWGGGLPASTNPGTGSNATSFGSGGGGGRTIPNAGGKGGDGLVQIRYAGTQRATGGQIQTALLSGSYYTLHTFTASGIFTPTR